MSTGKRVETSKGAITLDNIKATENQKEGTLTAQVRQVITTNSYYPSKKVDSNLQDSLFAASDFGFSEKKYQSLDTRVAWIPVPLSVTKEQVETMLKKAMENGACIYKVLSHEPIIDENQQYAIDKGIRTKDQFADTQVVRYPQGSVDAAGNDISNDLVLNNGLPQYKRTFFSKTPKEDVDNRDSSKVFMSAAIKMELQGASAVTENQTV